MSVKAGNVYSYRVLETDTTKAVLRVYKTKPKRWLWTFAIGATETLYVFEVPYGSISHEVALN